MANTEKTAGADSYLLYGPETVYGTAVVPTLHLGLVQTSNVGRINRNVQPNRGLKGTTTGGQEVAKYTLGVADAGFTTEFNVFDWGIMQYVVGARTGAGTGASPFVYSRTNQVASLTFAGNIDNDTTDRDMQALGTKINSFTIRADIGSPVTCTAEWLSGKIAKDTTLTAAQALPANDIMNFTGATLEIPHNSALSNIVDNVEIIITRNTEQIPGLGTDIAKNALFKAFDLRINFTVKYLDETLVQLVMGGSSALTSLTETTLTVVFTNGTNRTADFAFTGVVFPEYDNPQSVNEILTEGLVATARKLIITEQVAA